MIEILAIALPPAIYRLALHARAPEKASGPIHNTILGMIVLDSLFVVSFADSIAVDPALSGACLSEILKQALRPDFWLLLTGLFLLAPPLAGWLTYRNLRHQEGPLSLSAQKKVAAAMAGTQAAALLLPFLYFLFRR